MRKFALLVFSLLFAAAIAAQDEQVVEEVIVQVNGDIITSSQFRERFEPVGQELERRYSGEELQQSLAELRGQLFNSMIDELLIRQRAAAISLRLSDELFRDRVEFYKRQIGATTDEEFQAVLAQDGMTLEQFRSMVEYQYFVEAIFRYEVGRELFASESRVQEFYDDNVERYTQPARIRLSQIVMPLDAGNSEQRLAEAEALLGRLRGGADFGEAYRGVTPGAGPEDAGDIGFVEPGELREEMAAAVAGLRAGEVCVLLSVPRAVVFVEVSEREEVRVTPLEEVYDRVLQDMYVDTRDREMRRYLVRLKRQSYIRIMVEEFGELYTEEHEEPEQ